MCKLKRYPIGICRSESRSGLRRKGSTASRKQYNLSSSPSTSSQLSVRSAAQSCPTSPRSSKGGGGGGDRGGGGTGSNGGAGQRNNPRAAGEHAAEIDIGELSELRRSSSIVSTFRPRSSPAGLYSYTGKCMNFRTLYCTVLKNDFAPHISYLLPYNVSLILSDSLW